MMMHYCDTKWSFLCVCLFAIRSIINLLKLAPSQRKWGNQILTKMPPCWDHHRGRGWLINHLYLRSKKRNHLARLQHSSWTFQRLRDCYNYRDAQTPNRKQIKMRLSYISPKIKTLQRLFRERNRAPECVVIYFCLQALPILWNYIFSNYAFLYGRQENTYACNSCLRWSASWNYMCSK